MKLVFSTDLNLVLQCNEQNKSACKIYNLSSVYERDVMKRLDKLIPPIRLKADDTLNVDYNDDLKFDLWYADYLLTDDQAFCAMFELIHQVYLGEDVYVLVGEDVMEFRQSVTESLTKFIQQRYGINASILNQKEDIETIEDISIPCAEHICNLDADKTRYFRLQNLYDKEGDSNVQCV